MKTYLYYISFLLFACIQALDAKVVIEEKVLEPALISVVYERTQVTDTLNAANDYKQDLLTLKAGKKYSAFFLIVTSVRDCLPMSCCQSHGKTILPCQLKDFQMTTSSVIIRT